MTPTVPLVPRQPVPELQVQTLDHGPWRLAERRPENFTLVVFYRGLHCPICAGYLADLESRLDQLAERGVEAIAISTDPEDRAREAKRRWGLDRLAVGYGLPLAQAHRWGLYVSSGIGTTPAGVEETRLFTEPGLFLVHPDGTLHLAVVQTTPFARPHLADLIDGLDFILGKGFPARGEVVADEEGQRAAAA